MCVSLPFHVPFRVVNRIRWFPIEWWWNKNTKTNFSRERSSKFWESGRNTWRIETSHSDAGVRTTLNQYKCIENDSAFAARFCDAFESDNRWIRSTSYALQALLPSFDLSLLRHSYSKTPFFRSLPPPSSSPSVTCLKVEELDDMANHDQRTLELAQRSDKRLCNAFFFFLQACKSWYKLHSGIREVGSWNVKLDGTW